MTKLANRPQRAQCLLLLRGEEWMPLPSSTSLSAEHRAMPNGPVITASYLADIEGERIVGWRLQRPEFSIHEVLPDGQIEMNLGSLAEALEAYGERGRDRSGLGPITCELIQKQEQIPLWLRQAARVQAEANIKARLNGRKVAGVSLFDVEGLR